jgi:hypothetical protein
MNPTLFEYLNLATFTLLLYASSVFTWYLAAEWRRGQLNPRDMIVNWHRRQGHGVAIALLFMCGGEGMLRMWVWWARYSAREGAVQRWMDSPPWEFFPLFGAMLQCVGLLCCIRVLTPDAWGPYAWVFAFYLLLVELVLFSVSVAW